MKLLSTLTVRIAASTLIGLAAAAPSAWAADLPTDLQAKVEQAKKRLTEMATDASLIAAVREANGRDAGGMNNAKWSELADGDAAVKAVLSSKVSTLVAKWETGDDTINKLVLRDQKGNLVAASTKPLLFNNASRPQFANALKGQPWAAAEVKPDPATQQPSVQVGVPVFDGKTPIGVLHTAVNAK
jgi:hypothetical protein